MRLASLSFPACAHAIDVAGFRACRAMTQISGTLRRVTAADCVTTCASGGGPPSGAPSPAFVDVTIRSGPIREVRLASKAKAHLAATRLYLPSYWREVVAAVSPTLARLPGARAYLTGSSILRPEGGGDVDVAIVVSPESMSEALRASTQSSLSVAGRVVDLIIMTRLCAAFWYVAFDLSEAAGWNDGAVEAPFAARISTIDRDEVSGRLIELAGNPRLSEDSRRRTVSISGGCCDPPDVESGRPRRHN